MDYANTAQIAFLEAGGTWAKFSMKIRYLVNCFLFLIQIGNNAVYILFVAQNLMPVSELLQNTSRQIICHLDH